MRSFIKSVVLVALLAAFWLSPAWAQSELTQAEVYKFRNQVELERQNQGSWSPANVGDVLVPQDAVRTAAGSSADLLFNEGTIVRTAERSIFRFPPGQRRFELESGSALVMIRPGMGESMTTTPEARIVSQGTAYFVRHIPSQGASIVGVLTNSQAGPVRVSNTAGDITVELSAGQFISIINGVMGLVEYFVLPMFYETVDIATGLGVGQEATLAQEPPEVQRTLQAIRAEAIAPVKNQLALLNGFCRLNVPSIQRETLSLVQLLFPGAIPPDGVVVQLPDNQPLLTPIRSLQGVFWLGNYCQANQGAALRSSF